MTTDDLVKRLEKHRAGITTPDEVKGLMPAVEAYRESSPLTHLTLKWSALTFCRPGEVRHAERAGIDWDNRLWRIPADNWSVV